MQLDDGLAKFLNYIEENLQATKTTGLRFIDPRRLRHRLFSKQNYVVFGRRGAGKSSLLRTLAQETEGIPISLNLEDFKSITFPNIILHVLLESFKTLDGALSRETPWYRPSFKCRGVRRKIRETIKEVKELIREPDEEEQQVKTVTKQTSQGGTSVGLRSSAWGDVSLSSKTDRSAEEEVSRTLPLDKLNQLRLKITDYKELFSEVSRACNGRPIFLILDDFYLVPKAIQPKLIDYFHVIAKGTNVFLKVATIRHRSILYRRTPETFVGVELGHDILDIDMDYTLDKFEDLKKFMKQLLRAANSDSGANLDIDCLFGGTGFQQLCLASGGVPRDFLGLFVNLVNSVVMAEERRILKVDVNEAAIIQRGRKLDALKVDSGSDTEVLEGYLRVIRKWVYEDKRTNAFLVAKPDLEEFPQAGQAIRELVDLRLLHLLERNTSSAPSDGRRYEAYILDVGLYENSRPRNFREVEPGFTDSKSRKDQIRAAPRLSLEELEREVRRSATQDQLTLPELRSM